MLNCNTQLRQNPVLCVNFREIDGNTAINFDDHISEQHAQEIIKLLKPNLVGNWYVRLTEKWGQFRIQDDDWDQVFEIVVHTNDVRGTMIVWVGRLSNKSADLKFLPFEAPLEAPDLIELLYSHVLEHLKKNGHCIIR